MKIKVPSYFKEFKCIASECEDTCCSGWEIVIDDETCDIYRSVKGSFGERLRNEIVHREGENIFVLKGSDCPFLNTNKMCDIYSEIGEDSLCYTCKQYPRYIEEFGNLREIGISLSCPEAARIILRDNKKVEFDISENQEVISSYNDIDAMLFMNLLQCRKVVIDILQNNEIELKYRAAIVLKFAEEIQEKIDGKQIQDIKHIKEKYLDNNFIKKFIDSMNQYKGKENVKYGTMREFINVFKGLKHINSNDPLGLDKALKYLWEDNDLINYIARHEEFNEYYKEKMFKFQSLLVYFVFRYFMKAVFDYDLSGKVKTAIASYLMIKELFIVRLIDNNKFTDEDAVDIMHMYSKDVEHLVENIDTLAEIFETNKVFDLESMLIALEN